MSSEFKVAVTLHADASQYAAEFTRAGQLAQAFSAQVQGGGQQAAAGLQAVAAQAEKLGTAVSSSGHQAAEGLTGAATAAQATSAALQSAAKQGAAGLQTAVAQAEKLGTTVSSSAQQAASGLEAAAAAAQTTGTALRAAGDQSKQSLGSMVQSGLAARTAQEQAAQGLGAVDDANKKGAASAGQHAAAMQMLSTKMTNVVGGTGSVAQAMLGAINPLNTGLTAIVAAAGLVVSAYQQGTAEANGYRQAIVMTGNAARTTVTQMTEIARAVGEVTGSQNVASQALTAMVATGAVASESLQEITRTAIELERYAGQPVAKTAEHMAKLGDAPVKASLQLNEQYHYLTDEVYRQIKALDDKGRKEEAAALAQRTYSAAMAERAAELKGSLGTLERAWEGLGNIARKTWDAMLNVGRAATLDDIRTKINSTQTQLDQLLIGPGFGSTAGGAATGDGGRGRAAAIARLRKELGELQAQAAPLEAADAQAQIKAQQQADEDAKLAARQRTDTLRKETRSRADIRKEAIEQLQRDKKTLGMEQVEYEKLLDAINAKYKDPKQSTAGQVNVTESHLISLRSQLLAAQQYYQQLQTLGASATELNAGERESLKLAGQLKVATDAKTRAKLEEAKATADALGVQLRSNDGLEKYYKSQQQLIAAMASGTESIAQRAKEQEAANTVFGKGRTAIEQMTLAELEHQMAEAQGSDRFTPQYIASLDARIEAQKRWVTSLQQGDYKAVMQHADELLRNANEMAAAYKDELALSKLSGLEREKIVAQRAVELKYAKELAKLDQQSLGDTEKQAARERLLEAQRIESAAAVGRATQTHMTRASDEINRSLTDALMRGFESGKGFAQNFKDTVQNMFNTMVLRPIISAVMTPVSVAINSGVQGGLNAIGLGGGSSAAGVLSGVNNLSSLYSAFSGGLVSTVGGAIGSLGSLFGSSALTSFATGMKGATLASGLAGPTTAGAGGAMGLGAGFATALPWIAGGLAIASLLGGMSFGSRGANHSGGAYSTLGNGAYDLGLRGNALGDFTSRGNAELTSSVKGLVTSTVEAFDYLGKYANETFKGVNIAAGFAVNGKYSDEDAYAYFKLFDKESGGLLADYSQRDGGLGSDANAAWATFSKDLLTSVYGQFMKADLTGWVRDEMSAIDGQVTFENLAVAAQKIATIDAAFVSFGKTIDGMADLTGSVQTALIRTSGSFDALAANVNSYYASYYSETERIEDQVASLAEVFAKYDATLPATKEQYRALVEQQLAAGDAGAEFAAVLLGLNQQFGAVADAWAKELSGMSTSVTGVFAHLKSSMNALSVDVERSRQSILRGSDVMTAEDIQLGISSAALYSPSVVAFDSAKAAAALAADRVNAASQPASVKAAEKQAAESGVESTQQSIRNLDAWFAGVQQSFDSFTAYRDWAWSGAGRYHESMALVPENARRTAQYKEDLASYTAQREAAVAQLKAQQAALSDLGEQAAATAQQLEDAQKALKEAQQAEMQARVDYAAQVAQFVTDSAGSVNKLSDLRGEIVSFYEAQAQAAQVMLRSASNLRSVVSQARFEQLDTAQTAAALGSRYAADYAMVLSTTGSTRAGYVDSMASNLQGLSEALKAEAVTGAEWRIETAKLFAQANKSAGLLESEAKADDYKDVALGLLDSIDSALAKLSGTTKSAEQVIADAIKDGSDSNLTGLRAVVAALQGKSVPAFAAGGQHGGGLRLVGELGPELEVTGAARYWSATQTRALLSGGGGDGQTARELQSMRSDMRAIATSQLQLLQRQLKLQERWDAMGMPATREEAI